MTDGDIINQLRATVEPDFKSQERPKYTVFRSGTNRLMIVARIAGVLLEQLDINAIAAKLNGKAQPNAIFSNGEKEGIVIIDGRVADRQCEVWLRVCPTS